MKDSDLRDFVKRGLGDAQLSSEARGRLTDALTSRMRRSANSATWHKRIGTFLDTTYEFSLTTLAASVAAAVLLLWASFSAPAILDVPARQARETAYVQQVVSEPGGVMQVAFVPVKGAR